MDHPISPFGSNPYALLMFDEEHQDFPSTYDSILSNGSNALQNEPIEDMDNKVEECPQTDTFPSESEESTSGVMSAMEEMALSQPASGSMARGRGRKMKPETKMFAMFRRTKKPFSKLKKEYLRVKVIRGFKRGIRQVLLGKLPNPSKIHGFHPSDKNAMDKWSAFCEFVISCTKLHTLAQTSNGPKTDGRAFRRDSEEAEYNCFNNHFCREFFRDPETRAAFDLYARLLFHNEDESVLSAKFECEARSPIKAERDIAWRLLKNFICADMFRDLGLGS